MSSRTNLCEQLPDLHSFEMEKELASKLKLGDIQGATNLFKEILNEIYELRSIGSIRVRVLELVVVLSRAAVEAGADFQKVSEINDTFLCTVTSLKTPGEIVGAALQALRNFMKHRSVKKPIYAETVNKAKQFILNNYSEEISLDDIARAAFVSPYHLSHLFKEVEGISVFTYLTKVRLEKAKLLLRNRSYTINQISLQIGFRDPGYFAKVFRRVEGRTPSQFRQLG